LRRWGLWAVLAVLAVGSLTCLQGAPIGHFRSGEALDRFTRAYTRAMADLPPPDDIRDLRTSYGIVRAYRFDGASSDAAPLVLLPGRASASPVWADNLPSLLAVRSVWTLDLLGEPGKSIQERPIVDDADQARWLAETVALLGTGEVHLIGVSIGGWTALNLAIRHPDRLRSVTVLDPVFTFAGMSSEAIVRSIPAAIPWLPKRWRDSFNSWTAGGAPVDDVAVADMIEAGMQAYRLALPPPSRLPEDALTALEVPVLAIIAGRSPMHDAAAASSVARQVIRHGRVVVYPGASHAISGEYPDEIAKDAAAFIADVEAGRFRDAP
jgi:pimeloyl-ACP methyl ester carboxylesterase